MTQAIIYHLPALQVVIPLICAPLCVLLRPGRAAHAVAALGAGASFAIAALLLLQTSAHGARSYALGGWAAPWGIEYRVDLLSAFVLFIVTAVAAVVFPLTRASVEREVEAERRHLFYAALMLSLTGMTGIAITGDLFNLFVFLEIASLSAYVLVAFGRGGKAKLAALRYLVAGTVGATFVLIGIGLLYATTGTLNMGDMASRLPRVGDSAAVKSAFAFLVMGIAIKMALFPPSCLASRRLRLRAVSGERLSRRQLDQSRGVRPDSSGVRGVRHRLRFRASLGGLGAAALRRARRDRGGSGGALPG